MKRCSGGSQLLFIISLIALWGVLPVVSVSAQGVSLVAREGVGFMYGTAKELVLVGTFPISELDWALQPVFFEESSLEVKALGGLHGMIRVRVGIPSQSGLMTDSDWLNYSYDGNTDKTNFSQSNSFTDSAVFVDARLGWEALRGEFVQCRTISQSRVHVLSLECPRWLRAVSTRLVFRNSSFAAIPSVFDRPTIFALRNKHRL